MGADWPPGFLLYGNRCRTRRCLSHRFLDVSTIKRFNSQFFEEARRLSRRFRGSSSSVFDIST